MAQHDEDVYASTVLRAHEILHETLGFQRRNYTADNLNKSSTYEPSQLANQLGSALGALIIAFIIWFLFQGL